MRRLQAYLGAAANVTAGAAVIQYDTTIQALAGISWNGCINTIGFVASTDTATYPAINIFPRLVVGSS